MLTAKQMMTKKIVSVSMDASLARIREVFEAHGFHHLVVLENKKPVGVISDRDVLRELSPYVGKFSERSADSATLKRRAHQIMSREVFVASEETEVCDLIRTMLDRRVGCLPIVDAQGCCSGIVTWRDILGWCADEIFCIDSYCRVDEIDEEEAGGADPAQAA